MNSCLVDKNSSIYSRMDKQLSAYFYRQSKINLYNIDKDLPEHFY